MYIISTGYLETVVDGDYLKIYIYNEKVKRNMDSTISRGLLFPKYVTEV